MDASGIPGTVWGPVSWERMSAGIEKVRDRLYAVIERQRGGRVGFSGR